MTLNFIVFRHHIQLIMSSFCASNQLPEEPKKKKKKGEPDVDLFHMPPEYTSLAQFHLELADMLDGELQAEAVFMKSGEELEGNKSPTASETSSKKVRVCVGGGGGWEGVSFSHFYTVVG